jgi:hypothetical protein
MTPPCITQLATTSINCGHLSYKNRLNLVCFLRFSVPDEAIAKKLWFEIMKNDNDSEVSKQARESEESFYSERYKNKFATIFNTQRDKSYIYNCQKSIANNICPFGNALQDIEDFKTTIGICSNKLQEKYKAEVQPIFFNPKKYYNHVQNYLNQKK